MYCHIGLQQQILLSCVVLLAHVQNYASAISLCVHALLLLLLALLFILLIFFKTTLSVSTEDALESLLSLLNLS